MSCNARHWWFALFLYLSPGTCCVTSTCRSRWRRAFCRTWTPASASLHTSTSPGGTPYLPGGQKTRCIFAFFYIWYLIAKVATALYNFSLLPHLDSRKRIPAHLNLTRRNTLPARPAENKVNRLLIETYSLAGGALKAMKSFKTKIFGDAVTPSANL